jgi:NADP-dependent 3-hydroxy acid dehydrogenase YdfG
MTSLNQAPVAVITGASSGIGAATARALAAGGHRVALLARRVDRITALADELGDGVLAIEADVTDRDALVAAADRVRKEFGRVDVLVNNAGIMLLGPFSAEQRADYRQMVEVNLLGAITAAEVFLDQLKDGGGDIVNISSVAGRTARRQRCVRGHQVGSQRLVGVAATGAAARRPGHPDRARGGRDRAAHPHHPRRNPPGHRAALRPGRGHRR